MTPSLKPTPPEPTTRERVEAQEAAHIDIGEDSSRITNLSHLLSGEELEAILTKNEAVVDVLRYSPCEVEDAKIDGLLWPDMKADADGEYVKYEALVASEARCRTLERDLAGAGAMEFSADKNPTEPGAYWWISDEFQNLPPTVLTVYTDGLNLLVKEPGDSFIVSVARQGGLWGDRIPVPALRLGGRDDNGTN